MISMMSSEPSKSPKKKEPWLENYEFFETQLPSLIKNHKGEFAIVKDKQIIHVFETIQEANEYVKKENLTLGTFLIQEITDRVHYISRVVI